MDSSFSTSYSTLNIVYLFDIAILVGVKWYLTVVWVFISWWIMMLTIFPCANWLFKYLIWGDVYSDQMNVFWQMSAFLPPSSFPSFLLFLLLLYYLFSNLYFKTTKRAEKCLFPSTVGQAHFQPEYWSRLHINRRFQLRDPILVSTLKIKSLLSI